MTIQFHILTLLKSTLVLLSVYWLGSNYVWATTSVSMHNQASSDTLPTPNTLAPPNTLDPTEQQIVHYIKQQQPAARHLLAKVVNINSGTMNFAGNQQVGKVFAEQFATLGFNTRWIDGAKFNRAGHFFAEKLSDPSFPKILMIGHLDTVFPQHSPQQIYQELSPDIAKGPGVIDMKGGDVIILYALKALQHAGVLNQLNIQVVMTGDEEKRGTPLNLSAQILIDSAQWADIALGFENADSDPKTAVTARRGYIGWQLTVKAPSAHSSQIFRNDIGFGAIYEATRILDALRRSAQQHTNLTINPGLIIGGTDAELDIATATASGYGKSNVIAKTAHIQGDLRAMSLTQQQQAQAMMRAIVAEHLPHATAELSFDQGYPPMAASAGNQRLLSLYDQASRDLGLGGVTAVDPRRAGAADISFAAEHVDMAMDGLGLMGHGAHTDDETADLRTLSTQTQRAALLLYRLGQSQPR